MSPTAAKTPLVFQDAAPLVEPQVNAAGIHEWPFNASMPIDVRHLRFQKRASQRMRRHDYLEIFYANKGGLVLQVGTKLIQVNPGDLFVIGSHLFHRIAEYQGEDVRISVLYFMPELLRMHDGTGDGFEYLMPFLVQHDGFSHAIPAATGIPARSFECILNIGSRLPPIGGRDRAWIKTLLRLLVLQVGNHYLDYSRYREAAHQRKLQLDRLKPLFAAIDRDYDRPFSVEKAAKTLSMSKSHFMRSFKNVTGEAFTNYLNHFRVSKAEYLLASTDLTIAEISQIVGFCDQSYFGLTFRRFIGVTPTEYRRSLASTQV